MRVLFVGHPGSGKTYAATRFAQLTGDKEIDIDDLLHDLRNFFFRDHYKKAFNALLKGKTSWVIDGYGGPTRMPAMVWNEADHIVYINLPRSELRQNVYSRYKFKKANKEFTHGQHLRVNVIKNLSQIYLLDASLRKGIRHIQHSPNARKLLEVHSRQELDDLIGKLGHKR